MAIAYCQKTINILLYCFHSFFASRFLTALSEQGMI
jgi:hypothetical protein